MFLMRNWSLFGQHPTTATDAEMLPPFWPFKQPPDREAKIFSAVPDSERVIPPRNTTPYFL